MRRVRVAIISIGTMVSCELILFHGKLFFLVKKFFRLQKKMLGQKIFFFVQFVQKKF